MIERYIWGCAIGLACGLLAGAFLFVAGCTRTTGAPPVGQDGCVQTFVVDAGAIEAGPGV